MMPQCEEQVGDICNRIRKVNGCDIGYDPELDFTAGLVATVLRQAGEFFGRSPVLRDIRNGDLFDDERQVARRRAYARFILRESMRELSRHYATDGSPIAP